MPVSPAPIDPRGPRFNQAVLTLGLVAAWAADARWVVPAFAVALFLGAAFGPRYGPFLRLYAEVIRPRLRPPEELEDARPPRFAAAIGVLFLGAAAAAFALGEPGVGWTLALVVAALAALAATTGICVGCEVYLWGSRMRHRGSGRDIARLPSHLVGATGPTWVVFTTPYCAGCGPVVERLRSADPAAHVVTVDATDDTALADAFRIRSAPTVLLADASGQVQARLVGRKAVEAYLQEGSSASDRRGLVRSRVDTMG